MGGGVAASGEKDTAGVVAAHQRLLVNDVHQRRLQEDNASDRANMQVSHNLCNMILNIKLADSIF